MDVRTKTFVLGCALIVSAWGCSDNNAVAQDAADTVLTNGKIYTVNDEQPWAEAVAVRGDEIVYVGDKTGNGTEAGAAGQAGATIGYSDSPTITFVPQFGAAD